MHASPRVSATGLPRARAVASFQRALLSHAREGDGDARQAHAYGHAVASYAPRPRFEPSVLSDSSLTHACGRMCGRNVDAYSFGSGSKPSSKPKPGSEQSVSESCSDVRRRLSAGLLSCARKAYPDETIPAAYHSSQLWSWYLKGAMSERGGANAQAERERRLRCASPGKGAASKSKRASDGLQTAAGGAQSEASSEQGPAAITEQITAMSEQRAPGATEQAATATTPPFRFYVHRRDPNSTEGASDVTLDGSCWTHWSDQTFAALLRHPWRSLRRSQASAAFVEVESRFEINYPLFDGPRNG